MNIDLTDPIFHDEDKARGWLEATRWGDTPFCPHCGSARIARMQEAPDRQKKGKPHREGLFHCSDCRGQFTVRTGQVMERSHVPLAKWVLAYHLMASSKKGVSAHQLHRTLKVAYNTAWFMAHRIREAMADQNPSPLGGEGKVVEADEAHHGKRETPRVRNKHTPAPTKRGKGGKGGGAEKRLIVALVERGGKARAKHMNQVTAKNLREFVVLNADRQSHLHADESNLYPSIGEEFAKHETVMHSAKGYARGDVTTNTEGFFGILKRGMNGVYQHCGEQHLQRYLDEFTFRYNTRAKLGVHDAERAELALQGGEGKRLTWRLTNES